MIKYILAKHTGKGFYTSQDRSDMPNFSYSDGVAVVDGQSDGWITRIKGQEIAEKQYLYDKNLKEKLSLDNEIAEIEGTLSLKRLDLESRMDFLAINK